MEQRRKKPKIQNDKVSDLHGLEYMDEADLVIFMAGNQFMLMPELIQTFQKKHPEVKKIYYQTLPPGLMRKQIEAGGALFRDKQLTGAADIYTSVVASDMEALKTAGYIKEYIPYISNKLVLTVPKGNPAGIKTVKDLAKADAKVSFTCNQGGVSTIAVQMLYDAGRAELVRNLLVDKIKDGSNYIIDVHHRDTPKRLMEGLSNVGISWYSEYKEYERKGLPIEMVEVGPEYDQSKNTKYMIAKVDKVSKNPKNAEKFLKSKEAQDIYAKYGFIPLH